MTFGPYQSLGGGAIASRASAHTVASAEAEAGVQCFSPQLLLPSSIVSLACYCRIIVALERSNSGL